MKKKLAFLIFSIFTSTFSYAIENHAVGARPLALSNAFVSVSDVWSTFHNQAGLASFDKLSAAVYYESRFSVDELSLAAGTFVLPTKSGNFGLSFFQFGKGSFKENKVALAFAKQLGETLSAAVQFDYLSQVFPENERANGFATFEAGIIYSPTGKLFLGTHIFNPISGGIETPNGKQKMPAVCRIGGHYQFDETILLIVEAQKDSENPILLKTGLEFSPVKNLFLRFGVSGLPVNYTAGIGYRVGKISTDIAFSYHGNLGLTPAVSLQIEL